MAGFQSTIKYRILILPPYIPTKLPVLPLLGKAHSIVTDCVSNRRIVVQLYKTTGAP
jgi:hypothetical protein